MRMSDAPDAVCELDNPENVTETISFVNKQQQQIMEKLNGEVERLESELHIGI